MISMPVALLPQLARRRRQRLAGRDALAQARRGRSSRACARHRAVRRRRREQHGRRDARRSPAAARRAAAFSSSSVAAPTRSGNSSSPPSPNVNASGGLPVKRSSGVARSVELRPAVADGQHVAVEVHRALRLAGRARRERDQRDVVGRRVDRRRTSPACAASARLEAVGGVRAEQRDLPRASGSCGRAASSSSASRASHSACVIARLGDDVGRAPSRAAAASCPTAMPPAFMHARTSTRPCIGLFGARSSTRLPGTSPMSSTSTCAMRFARSRELRVGPAQPAGRDGSRCARPSRARSRASSSSVAQLSRSGYRSSGSSNRNSGHASRGGRLSRANVSTCAVAWCHLARPALPGDRSPLGASSQSQQLAADDQLLHLGRAFVDAQRADLAVQPLDRPAPRVTPSPPKQLHGARRSPAARIRSPSAWPSPPRASCARRCTSRSQAAR